MRFGIIGCGLIGRKRADAIRAAGHQVAAVADNESARALSLAAAFGAEVFNDAAALCAQDLDAVVIATAHDSLACLSLTAVKAGRHVLVEKPAARTHAELLPVAQAAAKAKRLVKVGFNHRFHPAIWKAREMVAEGLLGPMMFVRGRYGHGGRIGYDKEWRAVRAVSGGGELIDQGSHLIDLSRWIMGELTLDYAALPTCYWRMEVEDNCFLALKGRQQEVAWLHASWSEWKNVFCLEIYGRDGKLTIDGLGGSYGTERLTYHRMLPEMGPPETTSWEYPFPDMSWQREIENFAQAISSGERPVGDIEDALAVLAIVDDANRKARP